MPVRLLFSVLFFGSFPALWKLTGAGHVRPRGALDYVTWLPGAGTRVIDANEEMWRFFSRHKLAQ